VKCGHTYAAFFKGIDMNAAVIPIRPKEAKRRYRNHDYKVTYIPSTKQWKWEVTYVQTTRYSDIAKTLNAAFKAAEKHIDATLKMREK
jgi:hypothetical protein